MLKHCYFRLLFTAAILAAVLFYSPPSAAMVDANVQQSSRMVTLDVCRDLKIGQFSLNRLTKTIAPDGSASGTEYDAVGRVAATIDANGSPRSLG